MLNSFRIGAASVVVLAGLVAGCAGPQQTASTQGMAGGHEVAASSFKRPYLSKCDEMTDDYQRQSCYAVEREEDTDDINIDN